MFAVGAEVGGGDEVGADAVAEVAGFSDVDDDAAGVFHEVDAGAVGESFGFFAEAREADGVGFGGRGRDTSSLRSSTIGSLSKGWSDGSSSSRGTAGRGWYAARASSSSSSSLLRKSD